MLRGHRARRRHPLPGAAGAAVGGGHAVAKVAKSIEFPVYAIALGLIGNAAEQAGARDALSQGFRRSSSSRPAWCCLARRSTSRCSSPRRARRSSGALLISIVFGFTWWLGRLDSTRSLRALLASAVSICGVSAAVAAAGAVQAKREQLAYAASLVIAFAPPSIFLSALARRRLQPLGRRRRRLDRRQHRHHRRRRRRGGHRRRGRPADRHHRQDHPERVDRVVATARHRLLRA